MMTGVARMSVETKQQIQEKLERSRRLLRQMPDANTAESLRGYIEELEAKLLLMVSEGPRG
jgi:hypothetical protein